MALKSTMTSNRLASVAQFIGIDPRELENLFVCEEWSAELATGLVWLGPQAASLHGTPCKPCGIMDLIHLYDPADWQKVLQALEDAATASTTFSFSTTIRPGPRLHRPVFCFGQSETVDGSDGTIHGTFAIARVCMETLRDRRGWLN
jgi:hypothetical protein